MGNKHSHSGGHRATDPTARSFSWQQEPGFGPPVDHLPNPGYGPHFGPPRGPSGDYGMVPPGEHRPRPRSQSVINGSIVRDEAVFGGVHPINQSEQQQNSENSPPWLSPSGNPDSPNKKSRPGTSDSGYFTGLDSDPKARSRLRGSRLSLNEAVFSHHSGTFDRKLNKGPPPPGPSHPPMFPPPPHGPMPFYGPYPPPPPFFDPFMGPLPPDFDSKKMKKWRKKQKKLMRKGSLPRDMPGPFGPPMPFGPHPGMPPPPPQSAMPYRAQSIDDFMAEGMVQQTMPPPPLHMFSSQQNIMHMGPPDTPVLKKGKSDKKGTSKSLISDNASSGKGSRRSRQEATHFEEERAHLDEKEMESTPIIRTITSISEVSRIQDPKERDSIIYGSLKQRETQTMVATAEISAEQSEASGEEQDIQNPQSSSPVLPVKVSPEAQAILDKNAQLFSEEIPYFHMEQTPETPEEKIKMVPIPPEPKPQKEELTVKPKETKEKVTKDKYDEDKKKSESAEELEIIAVNKPMMPRLKQTKPTDFERMESWRAIDVIEIMEQRLPHRDDPLPPAVEEDPISVRLVPVPPSPSDGNAEPIYLEYNGKLPEFKKRLIETGSFDMGDIQKPQTSKIERPEKEEMSEKKSDWRIRPSRLPVEQVSPPAPVINQHSNWNRAQPAAQVTAEFRYASNGSLTPSIANIQAGDMSDIDFSWVHDLETKMGVDNKERNSQRLRRNYGVDYSYNKQETTPTNEKREFNLQETAGHSTPTGQKRPVDMFRDRDVSESYSSYNTMPKTPIDEPMPSRYFGLSEPYPQPTKSPILQHRESNVKAKAAMFESEAERTRREMDAREGQISRTREQHKRSQSVPHRRYFDQSPYIPHPDYNEQQQQQQQQQQQHHHQQQQQQHQQQQQWIQPMQQQTVQERPTRYDSYSSQLSGYYGSRPFLQEPMFSQQLSVDTNGYSAAPPRKLYDHFSPISPSERRIRRFEGNRQMNASLDSSLPSPGSSVGQPRVVRESRLAAYNGNGIYNSGSPPSRRGDNRLYDATEYYRRNCMEQRNREVQEKASKKGWYPWKSGSLGRNKTTTGSQLSVNKSESFGTQQPPPYASYHYMNGGDRMQSNVIRTYT